MIDGESNGESVYKKSRCSAMLDVVLLEGVEWSFILRRIKIAPKRRHQNSMPEKEKRKGNVSRKRRKKEKEKKVFFFMFSRIANCQCRLQTLSSKLIYTAYPNPMLVNCFPNALNSISMSILNVPRSTLGLISGTKSVLS